MPQKEIKFNGNISVIAMRQGKYFVAYSPALDLSTCAETVEKAKKMFEEAFNILIKDTVKQGQLEKMLADLGWEKVDQEMHPPVINVETYSLSKMVQGMKVLVGA